jgi:hypothetical protein
MNDVCIATRLKYDTKKTQNKPFLLTAGALNPFKQRIH